LKEKKYFKPKHLKTQGLSFDGFSIEVFLIIETLKLIFLIFFRRGNTKRRIDSFENM
jgi:hypothetical protein